MEKSIKTGLRTNQQETTMNTLATRFRAEVGENNWLKATSLSPINGGNKETYLLLSVGEQRLPVKIHVNRKGGGNVYLSINDSNKALAAAKIDPETIFEMMSNIFNSQANDREVGGGGALIQLGAEERPVTTSDQKAYGFEEDGKAVTETNGVLEDANGRVLDVQI